MAQQESAAPGTSHADRFSTEEKKPQADLISQQQHRDGDLRGERKCPRAIAVDIGMQGRDVLFATFGVSLVPVLHLADQYARGR
jgi:hypothetical protein